MFLFALWGWGCIEEKRWEKVPGCNGRNLSELHPVIRDAFELFLPLIRRCKIHYAQFQ